MRNPLFYKDLRYTRERLKSAGFIQIFKMDKNSANHKLNLS
jgi:hypothetical protein